MRVELQHLGQKEQAWLFPSIKECNKRTRLICECGWLVVGVIKMLECNEPTTPLGKDLNLQPGTGLH